LTEKQAADIRDLEMFRMKKMQAYIAIRGADNMNENSDVPSDRVQLYSKVIRPVQDYRVNKTRWCVLRWPTPSMAQAAGMSTEAFENFISTFARWITRRWRTRWCRWKN
jgi:aminopeptidase